VASFFGKELLQQISLTEFNENISLLYGKVSDRALLRTLHFLTENERVKKAASALEDNRFQEFLTILKESGDSSYKYLQNVYSNKYETSQPIPVTLALSNQYLQGNGVCRVHGGGFAGTIQTFVKTEQVAGYKKFIEQILGENTCHILTIRKQGGIKVC
jgi:galactokinase